MPCRDFFTYAINVCPYNSDTIDEALIKLHIRNFEKEILSFFKNYPDGDISDGAKLNTLLYELILIIEQEMI